MQPSLLAGLAALVAASLWLASRRRPVTPSELFDGQAVAALNRSQISLVASGESASPDGAAQVSPPPLPVGAVHKAALLRQLRLQMAGDSGQRLAAIETAGRLGDRASVPLLQRGLRDVDPQVVLQAARAMERFRGRTADPNRSQAAQPVSAAPLPRNVSRTR